MRKGLLHFFKSSVAAICIAAVLSAGNPFAAASAAALTAKTTDYLNLRQGAGTNTKVILTLSKNVSVTVIDNSNSQWAKVKTASGKIGYCFKQYLSFSGGSSTGSPTSEQSAVTTDALRMRSGPSLHNGILLVLAKGTSMKVIDNSNSQWAKVQAPNGRQGWCSKAYLKFSSHSPTPNRKSSDESQAKGLKATTTDYLNIRTGPGMGYRVIVTLGRGVTASVLDNSNSGWVEVLTSDGRQGWCSRQYLKISGSTPKKPSNGSNTQKPSESSITGALVMADVLRLRSGPGTSYKVLGSLPYNTYLKALDKPQSGWIKVQTSGGKTGYVSTDYVKFISENNGSSVTLSASSISVPQGKTLWLQSSSSASWTSSNKSVATVSNGYVYAVSPGRAQITASCGSAKAICTVTVTAAEPIRATYASPNIASPGEKVTFTAITDTKRSGVKFVVSTGSAEKTLQASRTVRQTTNGVATDCWTACMSFNSSGVYTYKAYAAQNGSFSSNGAGSDVMVSTQNSETATTSEQRRASDKMIRLIANWEGYMSQVYADSLTSTYVPTIGYGCTLSPNAVFYNNISEKEAWAIMVNKLNNSSYTTELNRMIANNHFLMNQNQADCLISFAYNVGAKYFNCSSEPDFRKIMDNAVVLPSIPSGEFAASVTYDTYLYNNCKSNSSRICSVTSGTKATVIAKSFPTNRTGWYQVRLPNGKTGWINSGYVSFSNSSKMVHDLNYTNAEAFGSELILWNQAGGKFYPGLFYRRLGEANVYNYGDYSTVRYNKYNYIYPASASSLK